MWAGEGGGKWGGGWAGRGLADGKAAGDKKKKKSPKNWNVRDKVGKSKSPHFAFAKPCCLAPCLGFSVPNPPPPPPQS